MHLEEIRALEKRYVMQTYGRNEIALVSGEGARLRDSEGKEYIDLTSGIGVSCLGYHHPALSAAISDQAQKLMHCSNLFYSEPMAQVAEHLVKSTGLSRVFFANSGAEANEAMIKTARKYSSDRYGKDRYKIITLRQSFHGRTMTTLMATGQDKFHQYFYPLPEGFAYVEAGDLAQFKSCADEHVCAVIMEMIQGEGGVLPLDQAFVQEVSAYCKAHDILVCVDEVQTGIGRTGTLFCYEQYGIEPDIVSMAKGLGGGVPIGAILCGEKCADTLQPGQHGSTFGGNPVCCAGAINVLNRLDENMLAGVEERSAYIKRELTGAKGVLGVSGLGLMIGIQTEKNASDIIAACREKGVLVIKAKDKLRLLPALNIPMEQLKKAVAVIKACCA